MFNVLQPEAWVPAKGYANGIEARGRMVFVAGMIGWNAQSQFETDDFVGQCRQAMENIVATLACAGAGPQHMVRMTWYVKDKKEYLARGKELGKAYQDVLGRNYPAMTLVQVADLLEDRAQVEIEVTAVVPEMGAQANGALEAHQ
jgi:enamine deaminase RidA (YjgF/YER057c/UK114 family)